MSCTNCGDQVMDMANTVKVACSHLISGHQGVAALYAVLASKATNESAKADFLSEAEKHRRIVQEISNVVVPEVGDVAQR